MMVQLIARKIRIKISVLCIENEDMCNVAKYRDLSRATGGVYAQVDPGDWENDQQESIAEFADFITASNVER